MTAQSRQLPSRFSCSRSRASASASASALASTEYAIQTAFVRWFRAMYPGVLCYHTPNGEYRHPSIAKKLRLLGTVPGIPDLFIPAWRYWIELKRPNGRLSPYQKEVIADLRQVGYKVQVYRGFGDREKAMIAEVAAKSHVEAWSHVGREEGFEMSIEEANEERWR